MRGPPVSRQGMSEHPTSPSPPVARATRRLGVHALAFGAGFLVMVIEIAGARVIAPVFGLSAVPWTAVIGVILAALALGNHLGGRLADRGRVPLAAILALAGASALLPVVGGGLPWWAARGFGYVGGAVVSAALLFALPVLALGTVVPYLVKADTASLETVGRRAGDVSASATLGSIAGTFLTGFVLLPLLSLPVLLGAVAALLLGLAAVSAVVTGEGPAAGPVLVVAALAGPLSLFLPDSRPLALHREETIHGSLRVTEGPWADGRVVRELWQNGGSSSAEVVGTGDPAHAYARVSLELLESLPVAPGSVLVLGGAALTLPVALLAAFPDARIEVIELDPAATRLAAAYFAFGELGAEPRLSVRHGDARVLLGGDPGDGRSGGAPLQDLVYLDVFDNLVSVPWTLVTVEALALMRDRLAPEGLLVVNLLSPLEGEGSLFLRRFLTTLESVFGVVRAYPVAGDLDARATQNVLVLAARDAAALPVTSRGQVVLPRALPVLSDAHAPVEYLQARVFLEGIRWR